MTDMMVRCVLSRQALRLREIGPRLTLELVKVEKGLCAGDVLYHRHMEKTAEEVAQIKADKAAAAVRTPLRPLLWSFLSCRLRPVLSFARAGCVWSCCSRFPVALSGALASDRATEN